MFAGLDNSDCRLVLELNSILYNCKKSGFFENCRLCLSVMQHLFTSTTVINHF